MRLVLLIGCLVFLTQEPNPPPVAVSETPSGEPIHGRIVLFAWAVQWLNAGNDFVVRVAEKDGGSQRYVRVIYTRNPHAPKEYYPVLNPMAFVGKGPPWTFYVVRPPAAHAEFMCTLQPDHTYEDGNETGTIPGYIRTPGAEENEIPDLKTLPCYLLVRNGLIAPAESRPKGTKAPDPR